MNKFRERPHPAHAFPHKPHLIPGTQEYATAEAQMMHDAAIEHAIEPRDFARHLQILKRLSLFVQALQKVNGHNKK